MPYASRQPVLVSVANRFVYNFAKDGKLCMLDFDYLNRGWHEIVLNMRPEAVNLVPENFLTPRDNLEMLELVAQQENFDPES